MAEHVCPWWLGYMLINPFRRLLENPEKILKEHVRPGATVLDVGCAMGYFTVPAARLVGPSGRVIAVDLQPRMISALKRRLARRELLDRVDARVCSTNDLGIADLKESVDFVMAFHVVHEIPDRERFFAQLFRVLKPGGRLLILEPKGHVSADELYESVAVAGKAGFAVSLADVGAGRSCLLNRPGTS